MTKLINFEKYRKERNLDPLVRYESMIRDFIKDVNISEDATLKSTDTTVTIIWKSSKGWIIATMHPASGSVIVEAKSDDNKISLNNVVTSVCERNRWIGYLFDDNMHS